MGFINLYNCDNCNNRNCQYIVCRNNIPNHGNYSFCERCFGGHKKKCNMIYNKLKEEKIKKEERREACENLREEIKNKLGIICEEDYDHYVEYIDPKIITDEYVEFLQGVLKYIEDKKKIQTDKD